MAKLEVDYRTLADGFTKYLLAQMEYAEAIELSFRRLERLAGIGEE